MNFASMLTRFKAFIGECARVIKVTKKPDSTEFKTIVKVSGLGMVAIGLIGFFFTMAKQIFFP